MSFKIKKYNWKEYNLCSYVFYERILPKLVLSNKLCRKISNKDRCFVFDGGGLTILIFIISIYKLYCEVVDFNQIRMFYLLLLPYRPLFI